MTSRWLWVLSQAMRRIWVRAALFSILGVGTALLAFAVTPYIPEELPASIGADAVDRILGILASSMLAVTTFSLSVMVSAYGAATSNVTPRATRLIVEDTSTQNMLSVFLGSFLFSLVGIIALSTGAYGDRGRLVLFVVTLGVVVLIVATLLRWIDHLSRLGRVTETTARVEAAALAAMKERHRNPCLGGTRRDADASPPAAARPVMAAAIGYVQHIDMGALADLAKTRGGQIHVNRLPGQFAAPDLPLAWAEGGDLADREADIRAAFTIGPVRSFDQDPRFGTVVLAEIAARALSPAVNDPGTAIDVIGRAVRVLAVWTEPVEPGQPVCTAVHVPPLALADLFDDLFTPIARDGAAMIEVAVRLQKALQILAHIGGPEFKREARRHSALALAHAERALVLEEDRLRIRAAAARV